MTVIRSDLVFKKVLTYAAQPNRLGIGART